MPLLTPVFLYENVYIRRLKKSRGGNQMNNELLKVNGEKEIENKIFMCRGMTVMLDSDIADLFGVETRRLNEQMKRNIDRFPKDFCFKINSKEFKNLTSQNAISSYGGKRHLPYVYTEHGVIALAGVLKSEIAAKMSVEIARTFIQMRKFIIENGDVLLKLAQLQNRQINFELETNKRFDEVIKMITKLDLPKQVLFYDGQYFDAYDFITSLIKRAKESILLIDAYCDSNALTFLKHKSSDVKLTIYKSFKTDLPEEVIEKFKKQYGDIDIRINDTIHDRFLIIDSVECYSLGTSLNYAGKRTFLVNKIEDKLLIQSIIDRVVSTEQKE